MIVYLIISFFSEICFNKLFTNNLLIPLFFLVSLILIYQEYNIDFKTYIISLILLGIFYDIVCTNTSYIDAILYVIIGCLNIIYVKNFRNLSIVNGIFLTSVLAIYQFLLYLFFVVLGLSSFSFYILITLILKSLIINILYYYLSLFILNKIDGSSYARITRSRDSKTNIK